MSKFKNANFDAYAAAIRQRESSGDYTKVNKGGYTGAYQFKKPALIDAGFMDDSGNWTSYAQSLGVNSMEDFKNNPEAQDAAFQNLTEKNWDYLRNYLPYVGRTIGGVPVTISGLLAGAHLVGHGGVKQFLDSNGTCVPVDGNRTPVTEYMKKFGGYDFKFDNNRKGFGEVLETQRPSPTTPPVAPIPPLQNGEPKSPPQPGPTTPPARSPQFQPSRPGIGPPLDLTPQIPELSPGMPIPGATGPTVIGVPGPLRPLVPPANSRSPAAPYAPTAPAPDGLPPLHFAPETPQRVGPFEVPGLFRSDAFGSTHVAPAADGTGTGSSILPTPSFGAPGVSAPTLSPAASGSARPLSTGNPVLEWWNGLVADVDAVSRRPGFGGLKTPMLGGVPTPPTQPRFDSGLPGLLARYGAFDPPAGGLLGMLQEYMRNNPNSNDVSA
jgi:hypothetical protein